jgi:hypothetical protein
MFAQVQMRMTQYLYDHKIQIDSRNSQETIHTVLVLT